MYITMLWIHFKLMNIIFTVLFLIYVSKTVKKVIQFGINTIRIFTFGWTIPKLQGQKKVWNAFLLNSVVIELKNLNSLPFWLPAWSINH